DVGMQSGARFRAGYWLGCDNQFAIEGSGFFLASRSQRFSANSNQFPELARPFVSLNRGTPFSQEVASPGERIGRIDIDAPTNLWGADLNLRHPLCCVSDCISGLHFDLLGGLRFVHLDDKLSITEQGASLATARVNPPSQGFLFNDTFRAHNDFYGA